MTTQSDLEGFAKRFQWDAMPSEHAGPHGAKDLLVYEALLWIIKETNRDASH